MNTDAHCLDVKLRHMDQKWSDKKFSKKEVLSLKHHYFDTLVLKVRISNSIKLRDQEEVALTSLKTLLPGVNVVSCYRF